MSVFVIAWRFFNSPLCDKIISVMVGSWIYIEAINKAGFLNIEGTDLQYALLFCGAYGFNLGFWSVSSAITWFIRAVKKEIDKEVLLEK